MSLANSQGQIFSVHKTSDGRFANEKPCEEAVRWDGDDVKEWAKCWYLPSFSFNDLDWFMNKYDTDVVISARPISDHANYEIEIYDDYRE